MLDYFAGNPVDLQCLKKPIYGNSISEGKKFTPRKYFYPSRGLVNFAIMKFLKMFQPRCLHQGLRPLPDQSGYVEGNRRQVLTAYSFLPNMIPKPMLNVVSKGTRLNSLCKECAQRRVPSSRWQSHKNINGMRWWLVSLRMVAKKLLILDRPWDQQETESSSLAEKGLQQWRFKITEWGRTSLSRFSLPDVCDMRVGCFLRCTLTGTKKNYVNIGY